jgi:hypothetical protein
LGGHGGVEKDVPAGGAAEVRAWLRGARVRRPHAGMEAANKALRWSRGVEEVVRRPCAGAEAACGGPA